uniref:uncharacterized protein n=1 Tax=Myxine glutinosa TaxID=7769 RepID=UPI00358E1E58
MSSAQVGAKHSITLVPAAGSSSHKTPPSPSGSRTSSRTLVFGLGASITNEDGIITGAKLPSGRQILRCMLYNCDAQLHAKRPSSIGALSRFEVAKVVLEQVRPFYTKANIPMVSDRRVCDKMVALVNDNNKLRRIPQARRSSEATARQVDAMEHRLNATFPLWSPNAEELIRDPEDVAFLASMKGDRVATFGMFAAKLQSKVKRRQEREAREAARQTRATKEQQETTTTSSTAVLESESDGSSQERAAPAECAAGNYFLFEIWKPYTHGWTSYPAGACPASGTLRSLEIRCSSAKMVEDH